MPRVAGVIHGGNAGVSSFDVSLINDYRCVAVEVLLINLQPLPTIGDRHVRPISRGKWRVIFGVCVDLRPLIEHP